jgi:hypothetical protein
MASPYAVMATIRLGTLVATNRDFAKAAQMTALAESNAKHIHTIAQLRIDYAIVLRDRSRIGILAGRALDMRT